MSAPGFSPLAATSVVVANMIGTGVFTSLGFQLLEFQSPTVIMTLWVLGGLLALCGALCYAELGAALPRSGGEYNFLTEIYHPAAGFVSGWISATIGFAAPTALAAITFGAYLSAVMPWVSSTVAASILIVAAGVVHATNRRTSSSMQVMFTLLKVALVLIFCIAALAQAPQLQPLDWTPRTSDAGHLLSAGFAVSLIYVNYAYSGWNAATYLSSEMDNPQKSLPKVLTSGTLLVMVLYVALNCVFLAVAPAEDMAGKVEVGHVAALAAFGETGGNIMGIVLALLLISTVSAMVLAGPRVLQVVGEDFRALGFLSKVNHGGVPVSAIAVQCGISLALVLTATFDAVLLFAGFTLALNTLAAVAGVFVLRQRAVERPFSVPLYPLPPLVFIGITLMTMGYLVLERPVEVFWGAVIVVTGALFYWVASRRY